MHWKPEVMGLGDLESPFRSFTHYYISLRWPIHVKNPVDKIKLSCNFQNVFFIFLNTCNLLNSCTELPQSVINYKSKVTTNAIKPCTHIFIHTTTRKTCCRVTSLHQESINLFHTFYQSIGKIILQKEGSPNNILRTCLPPTRSN